MHLTIVTTLYRSVPYIYEFYQRMSNAACKVTKDYEIVFINDGSDDESLEKAVEIHRNDHKVKVVDLSRNFGHHKAIMAGLSQAKGENIFLIDCDLEEDPELLEVLHAKLNEAEDADVVYGIQRSRKN